MINIQLMISFYQVYREKIKGEFIRQANFIIGQNKSKLINHELFL